MGLGYIFTHQIVVSKHAYQPPKSKVCYPGFRTSERQCLSFYALWSRNLASIRSGYVLLMSTIKSTCSGFVPLRWRSTSACVDVVKTSSDRLCRAIESWKENWQSVGAKSGFMPILTIREWGLGRFMTKEEYEASRQKYGAKTLPNVHEKVRSKVILRPKRDLQAIWLGIWDYLLDWEVKYLLAKGR